MYLALKRIPSQLLSYQQAVLFLCACYYRHEGAKMLDIGTGQGHSAAIMATASPKARVISLTPNPREVELAVRNTNGFRTVEVWQEKSWDFLERWEGPELELIFVDGDHKHVERDVPWWKWLRPGGTMLFHDYSAKGSPSPAMNVVNTVDKMAVKLGRRPDILVVDAAGTGMAGFRKRSSDG
jgi:predicted O-methyltransferase YrrM